VLFRSVAILVGLALSPAYCSASEGGLELVRRIENSWKKLQGLEITVVVNGQYGGELFEDQVMRFVVGHADTALNHAPYSYEELMLNPGEPHLDAGEIVRVAYACDGISRFGQFKRKFISKPSPGYRPSWLEIRTELTAPNNCKLVFLGPFLQDLNGQSSFSAFGNVENIVNSVDATIIGKERHAGVEAKLLRVKPKAAVYGGAELDFIVVDKPSVFLIGLKDARGSQKYVDEIVSKFSSRRIIELKEYDGVVLPAKYGYQREAFLVDGKMDGAVDVTCAITSVRRLPIDFVGLWKFTGPTGTKIIDENLRSKIVPFSDGEDKKIRKYLIANNQPVPALGNSWFKISVIGGNFLMVLVIFAYLVRKKWRST